MNYKFVLVENKYYERYWCLFIEDMKDLFLYFEQQQPKMIKEYFKIKKKKEEGTVLQI